MLTKSVISSNNNTAVLVLVICERVCWLAGVGECDDTLVGLQFNLLGELH